MSDRGAPSALAAEDTPPEPPRAVDVRPLLGAYDAAYEHARGRGLSGAAAPRLTATRIHRSLDELARCLDRRLYHHDDPAAGEAQERVERCRRCLPATRWRIGIAAISVVLAQALVSMWGSAVPESQRLLGAAGEADLTSVTSIRHVVTAVVEGELQATVFLVAALLAALSAVLLALLPGARRSHDVFMRHARPAERATFAALGVRAPGPPTTDILIRAVVALAALALGLHLTLMAIDWPFDDGQRAARIVLAAANFVAFAILAAGVMRAWRKRAAT